MKRLGEIVYGEKSPDLQQSLWLKRVEPFTCIPHMVDNKRWKPIKIIDSQFFVNDPILYIKSDTKISSMASFIYSDKLATKKSVFDVFSDKIYFYIAVSANDHLNKVITEYGENIVDDFVKIATGLVPFNDNTISKEYNLYEFKVSNSMIPLDASIKVIINDEND